MAHGTVLVGAWNVGGGSNDIRPQLLYETGNASLSALPHDVPNPVNVAWPRAMTALAADDHKSEIHR